ncbi:MAG: hypothetical protein IT581_21220 [Verrucomicrobiales bacterium]|nr:hypothetical protein [Verrucomicrobiales bacterium]
MTTRSTLPSKAGKSVRFTLLLLASCALLKFGAGCQRSPSNVDNADISAIYHLAAIDGKKVPASVNHEGAKLEIRTGEFVIRPDGTCSSDTTFVPPSGKEARRQVDATYTRTDHELRMKWNGAGITFGHVQGDRFTMTNEGMVLEYQR